MSLAGVIARFKTAASYTVTRRAATTVGADGLTVAGASSTFPIVASAQPAPAEKLNVLPEGRHASDIWLFMTETQLRTEKDGAGGAADRIAVGAESFEVFAVEGPWILGAHSHYEVLAARRRS